jgi:hypothetical protein
MNDIGDVHRRSQLSRAVDRASIPSETFSRRARRFLPQRLHRIEAGGACGEDPCGEQASRYDQGETRHIAIGSVTRTISAIAAPVGKAVRIVAKAAATAGQLGIAVDACRD